MSQDVPFYVNALAGGIGGTLQVFVGQPFDVVKTRIQQGLRPSFKPRDLFAGMSAPLVSASFLNVALFTVTGVMRGVVHRDASTPISLPQVIGASLLTAPVYVAFVTPVELIKVAIMTQETVPGQRRIGPREVIRSTIQDGGVFQLWRGYWPTCAMRLWGLPWYFGGNELTKSWLQARHPDSKLTAPELVLAGGMAGAFFWFASFPFDTIKTVVQSSKVSPSRAAADIMRTRGGFRGFYRGLLPCLLRSFPANGVVFVTVDLVTTKYRSLQQ